MLDALRTAIVDKFDESVEADELRKRTPGGLWRNDAPLETDSPYITFKIIDDIPSYSMDSTKTMEQVRVQFSIWSDSTGISEADRTLEEFQKVFDDVKLVVVGFGLFLFERQNVIPLKEEETKGHVITLDYMIWM